MVLDVHDHLLLDFTDQHSLNWRQAAKTRIEGIATGAKIRDRRKTVNEFGAARVDNQQAFYSQCH